MYLYKSIKSYKMQGSPESSADLGKCLYFSKSKRNTKRGKAPLFPSYSFFLFSPSLLFANCTLKTKALKQNCLSLSSFFLFPKEKRRRNFLFFPSFQQGSKKKNVSFFSFPIVRKSSVDSFSNFSLSSMNSKKMNLTNKKIVSFATKDLPEVFWNLSFNKGSLKNFVFWCFVNYGQRETIKILEKLQIIGFGYATKAGISLSIDDLKIPPNKAILLADADQSIEAGFLSYKKSQLTGLERFQRIIETWHQTSESLKDEMINNFRQTDSLNPVYMMAFSGARGNISQVRQLVAMRGLMSDPQGKILDFPIRSNFREGLTLTEYVISCYGARKGVVDTALRTANAGYLTRRLVDVAQHVIVLNFDCGTKKGFYLTEIKKFNKTLYSLRQRLLGRVLAANLYNVKTSDLKKPTGEEKSAVSSKSEASGEHEPQIVAFRNQEISEPLAAKISKITNKVFIRSPLTCDTPRLVCQLCYGWSLSEGYLVSIGEAVGIIAAQSIGEPGTQLTMRTFHTGGVFSGEMFDQLISPYDGIVKYSSSIPGTLVRTTQGKIAFLTKVEGKLSIFEKNNSNVVSNSNNGDNSSLSSQTILDKSFKLPAYTLLFIRNNETILKDELIAELPFFSSKVKKKGEIAEFIVKSEIEGQLYSGSVNILEKYTDYNDIMTKSIDWGSVWILSGKICQLPVNSYFFALPGDLVDENAVLSQIQWVVPRKSLLNTNSLLKHTLKKEIYFDFSLNQTKWFQKRNLETLNTLFNFKLGIEKKNKPKKRVLSFFFPRKKKKVPESEAFGNLGKSCAFSLEKKSDFFPLLQTPFLKNEGQKLQKAFSYYPFTYLSEIREKNGKKKKLGFSLPKLLSDLYPKKRKNSKPLEGVSRRDKHSFSPLLSNFAGKVAYEGDSPPQTIFFNQDKSLLLKMKIKIQTISDFTKVPSKTNLFSKALKKQQSKEKTDVSSRSFASGEIGKKLPFFLREKEETVSPSKARVKLGKNGIFSQEEIPDGEKKGVKATFFSHNSRLFPIFRQNKSVLSGTSNQFVNFLYLKDKITINLPLIFLCIDNINYKKIGYFFSFYNQNFALVEKKLPLFFLPERTFKNKNLTKLKDVFFVPKMLEQRNIISTTSKHSLKKNNQISNQLLHWFPKSYLTMKGGICVYRLTHDFFCQYINFHLPSFSYEKQRGALISNVKVKMGKGVSSNILARICWVNQDYKKTKLYTVKFRSSSQFLEQPKRLERQKSFSYFFPRKKKIRVEEGKKQKLFFFSHSQNFEKKFSQFGQAEFFQTVFSMSQGKVLWKNERNLKKESVNSIFFSKEKAQLFPKFFGKKKALLFLTERTNFFPSLAPDVYSIYQTKYGKKQKYSSFNLSFYKNLTFYCLKNKREKNKNKRVANYLLATKTGKKSVEKKLFKRFSFSTGEQHNFPLSKSEKTGFYNTNKKNYSFFDLKKTNISKKSLYNHSIINGFIYKPKNLVNAISLHKKFFLPGQKIIDDVSFDNFLIYVECIPEYNLSSLSETIHKNRFDKKIHFNLKKLIKNKMSRFIKTPDLLSNIPFAFLQVSFAIKDSQRNLKSFIVLITKVMEYPLYKPNHYKKTLYKRQKTSEQSFFHYSCKVKSKMLNKIFKNNYHSNVLNKQKPSLRLLDKFPNTDLVLALKCKGIEKNLMENLLKNPLNLNLYVKLGRQESFGKVLSVKKSEAFFLPSNLGKSCAFSLEEKKFFLFSKEKTFSVSQNSFKSSPFKKEKKYNFFSQAKAFDFNLTSKKSIKTENKLLENMANEKKFLSFSHLVFPIFFRKSFSKVFCLKFSSKSSIQLLELVLIGVQKNSVNNKIVGITAFNFFQKNKLKVEEKADFFHFLDKKINMHTPRQAKFVVCAFEKSDVSFNSNINRKKSFSNKAFNYENIKILNNNISQSILQPNFYFNYDQKYPFEYYLTNNINASAPFSFSFSLLFSKNTKKLKNYFLFYQLLSTFNRSNFQLNKSMEENLLQVYEQSTSYFSLISCFFQQPCFDAFFTQQVSFGYNQVKNVNGKNEKRSFRSELQLSKNLNFSKKFAKRSEICSPFLRSKIYFKKDSFSEQGEIALTRYLSPFMGEILHHENYYWSQNTQKNRYLLLTKKNQISFSGTNSNTQKENKMGKTKSEAFPFNSLFYLLKNKKNTPNLGEFLTKGDCFILNSQNSIISSESGLIVHSNKSKITLRKAQSFFLSPNCIFHYSHGDLVEKNKSILSLPFEQLKTGDIVQGIPKVEQLLEARSTFKGKEEEDNLHKLLRYAFDLYKTKFSLKLSVRKSFSFIQLILVNSVQRIYRSQGVSISDKHLEVIVKQMTSKVQITSRGDSSFFRGEYVDLYIVETWNALHPQLKKICYKPILLGISRSSLEVNSFLSAASFQHTKKVLSRSAFKTNIDFLNGLKENVIIGNLISAGTGNLNN